MGGPGEKFDSDFVAGVPPRQKHRTRHKKKMERFGPPPPDRPFRHVALRAEVSVRASVFPTEERERVEAAVRALFPDAVFDPPATDGEVVAHARDLRRLAEVIRSSRIRDAAREALKGAMRADGAIAFELNKQAAAAGHVNFALRGREALGSLSVAMECEEPLFLIEELTWIERESDERLLGRRTGAAGRPPAGALGRRR